VKHGGNFDDVMPQPIHDAAVAMDDLAERLVANLWYYPSRARAARE
jgi:hypothetical protein